MPTKNILPIALLLAAIATLHAGEPAQLSKATRDRIEKMTPLFDGKTLDGWIAVPDGSWTVKEGLLSSLGAGRGVMYTKNEYGRYRLIYLLRHAGVEEGSKDHYAGVLFFCAAPPASEKGLDTLGGIQLGPPNGGGWDYRPGKNNNGQEFFTRLANPKFNLKEWSQIELLVNAETGTARMAAAQPVGTKAVEVMRFQDQTAGRKGPFAWQMHNKGLLDEYKEIRIEVDPKDDKLITVEE
jgi:hypothetical protein